MTTFFRYTRPMRRHKTLVTLTLAWASASGHVALSQSAPQSPAVTHLPTSTSTDQNASLSLRIAQLLNDPAVSRAHWGIAVTALDGTPIFSLEDGKLFRPASTAKLFTTAAAMSLLGPGHQFKTEVFGDFDPATGAVKGDLILRGGGDPAFGTNDLPYTKETPRDTPPSDAAKIALADLIAQLTKSGITRVDGNVVAEDTLFEAGTPPQGWAAEDLLWGYGALPSALALGDNELRLTVTPKPKPADPAAPTGPAASIDQLFPYLQLSNDVTLAVSDAGPHQGIQVEQVPGQPLALHVLGEISPSAPPLTESLAVPDAAAYAAGALRSQLIQHGTPVTGDAVARHKPPTAQPVSFVTAVRQPGCESRLWGDTTLCSFACLSAPGPTHLLAEHTSAPLAEDIVFTLKTSANLHAEVLLHHLGLLGACPGASTLEGARVLHSWLVHIGLDVHDFMLYDGSGLSTKDLVTPRAEAQLLAYAATQPWFPQWKPALPVGGVDGTLASRFTEPPLKGHVYAKTGTLGETRALAGYVQCATGRELIVSIMVDNHEPGNSADRITMDQIVAAIAAAN